MGTTEIAMLAAALKAKDDEIAKLRQRVRQQRATCRGMQRAADKHGHNLERAWAAFRAERAAALVAHTERDLARALQAKAEEAQINLANKNREMRSDQLWLTRVVDALPRCHYCSQIGTVTDRYTYFCDEHNPGQDYLTEVSYAEAVRGRK